MTRFDAGGALLEVRDLRIDRVRGRERERIVSSIDLSLRQGETIGVVGESGSGKSMTARALIGLLPPSLVASGEIRYGDRELLALRERQWQTVRGREIGLVLQDPFTMLNPTTRCGRAIEESLRRDNGRLGRSDRRRDVARRLAEVGIADETVADRYPFQLSGGMRQRVAIAAALARDPNVLIADEPSTALDATTQREILALLRSIQRRRGMGLILITHDLRVAFGMCDRIYVLYAGSLVEVAGAAELEREPLHPYSHGLLLAEPAADKRVRELQSIPGNVPRPDDVAGCCPFAPRCRWAEAPCVSARPPRIEVGPERFSACVRLPEIRAEMARIRVRAEEDLPFASPAPMKPPVIAVENVSKEFGSGANRVRALDGVSIDVGEGESVGLVGESGSGKTTLARLIVGLESATTGRIQIAGVDATDWTRLAGRDRQLLRRCTQIVFQDPYSSLNPMRTVGATLAAAVQLHSPGRRDHVRFRVGELLEAVGLPQLYANRKPVALSGGERQRVAIARALAANPRILICDEPVSALDTSVQAQVLNLLVSLQRERGLGYLFITHDLAIVRQVAERVYVMQRGRIVESGAVDSVLRAPKSSYTAELLASVPRSEDGWLDDESLAPRLPAGA